MDIGMQSYEDRVILKNFPTVGRTCPERPILFSTFLSRQYASVDREKLQKHVQGKLKVFAEEELDVQLVFFDSVLDHIVRIHRVLQQPLGHCLLAGVAEAGKTVLSRYVAWMHGLSVFQIKAHRGYSLEDFKDDLRTVMRRAGCRGEKICFIFDKSNIMDSGFLEYMNALLASGEVPGLFEGDDYSHLIHQCREGVSREGAAIINTSDENELYKWFVGQVQRNLHIVFTMNPQSPDFYHRCATSPALFNRCTIDWFGEWSTEALHQVAREYTQVLDLLGHQTQFQSVDKCQGAVIEGIVQFHSIVQGANQRLEQKGAGKGTFITPRHYLDFICQFRLLFNEKREEVTDQQRHLNMGLQKLRDTEEEVAALKQSLTIKEQELTQLQKQANDKLEQMVLAQQKAEQQQARASQLEQQLIATKAGIKQRKTEAQSELGAAEPALREAEAALSSVKSQELRELRSYATPPATAKKVLSAVLVLLGEKKDKATEWDNIKSYMRKEDFISSIQAFESKKITESAKNVLLNEYMTDPRGRTHPFYGGDRGGAGCRTRSSRAPRCTWTGRPLTGPFRATIGEPIGGPIRGPIKGPIAGHIRGPIRGAIRGAH